MSDNLAVIIQNLPPEFAANLTTYTAQLASASSTLGVGEIPVEVLLEVNHLKEATLAGGEYPFSVERALGELMEHPRVTELMRGKTNTNAARSAILQELEALPRDQRLTRARALGLDKTASKDAGEALDAATIRQIRDPARRMTEARRAGL